MSAGVHVHFDPLSEVSRRVCLWSDVVFGVTSPPSRGSGDFRPEKTRRASFGSYPTLYQSMSSPLTITLHCHSGQPFGSFVVRVSQSEPGRSNCSFFVVVELSTVSIDVSRSLRDQLHSTQGDGPHADSTFVCRTGFDGARVHALPSRHVFAGPF